MKVYELYAARGQRAGALKRLCRPRARAISVNVTSYTAAAVVVGGWADEKVRGIKREGRRTRERGCLTGCGWSAAGCVCLSCRERERLFGGRILGGRFNFTGVIGIELTRCCWWFVGACC